MIERVSRHPTEAHRNILGPLQRGEQKAKVAFTEALTDAHELAQSQDGGLPHKRVPEFSTLVSDDSDLQKQKKEKHGKVRYHNAQTQE